MSRDNQAEKTATLAAPESRETRRARALQTLAELVRRAIGCQAAVISIPGEQRPDAGRMAAVAGPDDGIWPGAAVANDDAHLLADPVAAGDLGLAFYAGVPLRNSDGAVYGILAALDTRERELGDDALETLKLFARLVRDVIESPAEPAGQRARPV